MISTKNIEKQIKDLMLKNRRHSGKYSYTVPAPIDYPFQWLWDSCFHAIILRHYDIEMAKKELIALISKQFKNGMIPHMLYWDNPKNSPLLAIDWGTHRTSSLTQPPMLAYAVWSVYEKDQDKEFLKKMFPAIRKYHKYLIKYRDPHGHNLIGIVNPDESGEDNSPRFDVSLKLSPNHTLKSHLDKRLELVKHYKMHQFRIKKHMEKFHWVRDVPINAIFATNLAYESLIAKELGETNLEKKAKRQSDLVSDAMRRYMLEENGIMKSTMGLNYHHIDIKTWAIFAPMFARVLTLEEAQKIVDNHLHNKKEFDAPYSVPTVSMDEVSFDPKGFWRGPVWISTNWFIFKGLLNYGFKKEAKKILDDSLKLIEMSGLREQYDPMTGAPLGAKDFTWGGLVLDMLEDDF